jgi:HK97 family phage prohead protease
MTNRYLNPTEMRRLSAAITKFAGVVGERQVRAVISSEEVDRMGDVIVQRGIDYSAFMRAGGTVLWQHDYNYPVARTVQIGIVNGCLTATAQFPAEFTSDQSDECYRLIREGVVTGTSIGFLPRDYEPVDRNEPWSGLRFLNVELLEFSFVSVPAAPSALIIGKGWHPDKPYPRQSVTRGFSGVVMEPEPERRAPVLISTMGFAGDARTRRWQYAAALKQLLK